MAPARTYLFVPGNRPERFAKALASGADAVVLDLEDAVARRRQGAARATPSRLVAGAAAGRTARASSCASTTPASAWFADDLRLLRDARVDERDAAQGRVGGAGRTQCGPPCRDARVLALIESARGVANVRRRWRRPPASRAWSSARSTTRSTSTWTSRDESDGLAYAASRIAIASRVAGLPAPVAGVTPQLDDEARLLADLAWSRAPRLRRQAVHPPAARSRRSTPRCSPSAAGRRLGATRARRRSRVARRRPARRPNGRPTRRAAGRSAPCAAPASEPPLLPPKETPPWPPPSSTPRIFRRHLQQRRDAPRLVRREPHRRSTSTSKRALAKVQGRLGIIPQEAADEIVSNCDIDQIDMAKLRAADRAHRLSDPRRRLAAQRAVPRQARRVLPLGRDHAGHHRHRDRAADPRRPGASSSAISPRSRRRWPSWRRRYRDTPMIGRSNLQQAIPVTFGYKMAGLLARDRAPSRAPGAIEAARAGRRVRRRLRHAGVAREAARWKRRPA